MMDATQRKRFRRAGVAAMVLCGLAAVWDHVPAFARMERASLDMRYRHFNRDSAPSPRVIVVQIDDKSLNALGSVYGNWPWKRRAYKELVDYIAMGEPAGIYFDILLAEPQLDGDDDAQFAQSLAQLGDTVSLAAMFNDNRMDDVTGRLSPELADQFALRVDRSKESFPDLIVRQDVTLPVPAYLEKHKRMHSVNAENDDDGVFRREPLFIRYQDRDYPTMGLAAFLQDVGKQGEVALAYENQNLVVRKSDGSVQRVELDATGAMPVHFHKDWSEFTDAVRTLSYVEVINDALKVQNGEVEDPSQLRVPPDLFKNKYVFIGTSAVGLADVKATPVSTRLPGVYVHATTLSNLLQGDHLTRFPLAARLALAFALIAGVYGAVFFLSHLVLKLGVAAALWAIVAGIAIWAFKAHGVWMDLALPTGILAVGLVDGLSYLTFVEGRDKQKMKDTLSKYLEPTLIEEMIKSGGDLRAEIGKKKELSILFSDIRGFTTLSERLNPEKVVLILNEYLERMTNTVFNERGTLDKFIGDAVMAFWGAPVEEPLHAQRAVRCAMEMQRALARLLEEWKLRPDLAGIPLEIGIGVNSGPVIVGNTGSDRKLDYTVIGDNVNLASRLEGLTKNYGIGIVTGERTRELLGNSVVCRTVDKVRVKGKLTAVTIYEPLVVTGSPDHTEQLKDFVKTFEMAWSHYDAGRFAEALAGFESAATQRMPIDDPLLQVYRERCEEFIATPPAAGTWDGVFVALSK